MFLNPLIHWVFFKEQFPQEIPLISEEFFSKIKSKKYICKICLRRRGCDLKRKIIKKLIND